MKSHEIRKAFLDFFAERGHEAVSSSSIIPHDDPTLLFTNAGMNQFKAVLLGQERRGYVRATSAQKCMRVSGKHNDLEAVGRDGRHHTFFEMLGNWSFGDYYKPEAIAWAWEFLTQVVALDADRLSVSVYKDDDESFDLWRELGVPAGRIHRLGDIGRGDEENFWSMGDTGPCGPCTELHYDQGEAMACGDDCAVGVCDCDRWLEVWNLVFIQFDRAADGSLGELPLQSVDTGMGLERVAALVQGATTNYGTDLFLPLIGWVEQESGRSREDAEDRVSMQVIADHARALAFAVADGGRPGNDGRGYVLRRILRRAARHGRRLGFEGPFLHKVAGQVIELMSGHYRELEDARDHVLRVIRTEEERFGQTLDRGLERFAEFAAAARERGDGTIAGADAFQLHDTFGFPLDLTQVMAEEQGLRVDEAGFEAAMAEQRERARAASRFDAGGKGGEWQWLAGGEPGADLPPSRFTGHEGTTGRGRVLGRRELGEERWELILDATPFYAESGGQVGDTGRITGDGLELRVVDTRSGNGGPVHVVDVVEGDPGRADLAEIELELEVDAERRASTMRNHTATHLLHAALHRHVGEHAQQAGSLVAPDRLRFDFHHEGALGRELLERIEDDLNAQILADRAVAKHVDIPLEQAREMGAIAMFGEKYGERVRVVEVPDFSIEFCGGTHCDRTGQIGMFRITGESAVGAGVRRIEAVTGSAAVAQAQAEHRLLRGLGERLGARPDELEPRLESLQGELKQLREELERARTELAGDLVADLSQRATRVANMPVVAAEVTVADRDQLVKMGDALREELPDGVAVLVAELDGKVALLAVAGPQVAGKRIKAGDVVRRVAELVGGRGGGKPHLAQAGGSDISRIPDAVASVERIVAELAQP